MQCKITQEQADIFNEWQQETGKQPIYGAIDIQQLDFFTQNLNDADLYPDAKAQKISFDFLLLLSEYLNRAQICDISEIVDVNEYSQIALNMFGKFKKMIDFSFINFKSAYDTGSSLTAHRQEKQGKKKKAPASVAEMRQFCEDNSLQVAEWELEKFWRKNSRSHFAQIDDWQAYLVKIGKIHAEEDRQRKNDAYRAKVMAEHDANN